MSKVLRESSLVMVEAQCDRVIDGTNINDNIAGVEFSRIARSDEICKKDVVVARQIS